MRARLARLRAKVNDLLDREAKVRDLVKASLPLWISVVLACGAGFLAITNQRAQSCRHGREDIAEFTHLVISLNPNPEPARVAAIDKLLADFINACD